MSNSNLDQTEMFCDACGLFFTEADQIITCSNCETTYHSRCVGYPAAESKWYCPEGCLYGKMEDSDDSDDENAEEFDADRWILEKQKEFEREIAEKQARIDCELREKEEKMAETIRNEIRRQEAGLEVEKKKKADHEQRLRELESSYRRRSSILEEQLRHARISFDEPLHTAQIVDLTDEEEAEDEGKVKRDSNLSESGEESGGDTMCHAEDAEEEGEKPEIQDFVNRSQDGLGQRCSEHKKPQLAARRRTKKPINSSNDPAEWPQVVGTNQGSKKAREMMDEHRLVRFRDRTKGTTRDVGKCPLNPVQPVIVEAMLDVEHPEQLQQSHPGRTRELYPLKGAEAELYEQMEATDLTPMNPLADEDPVSDCPQWEDRLWANFNQSEATIFRLRNNPDMRAGTSRRRQEEDCCRKLDSPIPCSADVYQQLECHDHLLWVCQEFGKLYTEESRKFVAKGTFGDGGTFEMEFYCQSDICEEKELVVLPIASQTIVLGLNPDQQLRGRSTTAKESTAVSLIKCTRAVRLEPGSVREGIVMLRSTQLPITAVAHMGVEVVKDPDKPEPYSPRQAGKQPYLRIAMDEPDAVEVVHGLRDIKERSQVQNEERSTEATQEEQKLPETDIEVSSRCDRAEAAQRVQCQSNRLTVKRYEKEPYNAVG